MSRSAVRLEWQDYGDAGVLLELAGENYDACWEQAQHLGELIRHERPDGIVDVVASYRSVFVGFDPLATDHATVRALVERYAARPVTARTPARHDIPVVYGGEHGPDLEPLAAWLRTTPADLIRRHSGSDWTVRFVGSPVGAPLMDGPRMPASIPRLATPRVRVAPGSVAVSGFQSIVYNAASPGGWQILGRTPLALFDIDRPPYVPYRPGDTVRFRPVDAARWADWAERTAAVVS